MNTPSGDPDLQELFGLGSEVRGIIKSFRIVKRGGRLLLALPLDSAEAFATLEMYPAQRPLARLLKDGLRFLAGSGLPLPVRAIAQPLSADSAFLDFLERLAPGCTIRDRGLGILAGNFNAPGRRFLLLLFHEGHPAVVVKAGVNSQARELVRREIAFLQSTLRPGVERVIATSESASISAFAIRHVEGIAPGDAAPVSFRKILEPWLNRDAKVTLDGIPAWSTLAVACKEQPLFEKLRLLLGSREIHPAIFHGDFAPWNIKIHPATGTWQVFDWERGEPRGIPSWDWLHFEIQTAVLVRRESSGKILARLDRLFETPDFRGYSESAGAEGLARPLTLAYLLYAAQVLRQTEGAAQIDGLLQHASREWNV